MKITLLLLLFLAGFIHAQQLDLDYYVQQAKQNSPLINKSKNEGKITDLDLKRINSVLSSPEINIESSVLFAPIISHDGSSDRFEWVSSGATHYNGYDQASTDGGQYQSLITLNQPIFTGSMSKDYLKQADNARRKSENNIALTTHQLQQLVTHQYLLCLLSKEQGEISRTLLKQLQKQVGILEKLVENAIYKQTDLLLLQVEVQNYTVEYETFRSGYKSNLYDLNLICGINDTTLVDIQNIRLQPNIANRTKSKFLISYKLDSLDILISRAISEHKYRPQLNLFANAGLNAVYQPTINRLGFSTGLTFSWNLFDGHQREIEREKSIVNLRTLQFEKKNFITQMDISKNKILNKINSLNQRINLTTKQIKQYDTLFNAYDKELAQGEISVMDFKNLIKDIAAKKQENIQLKIEKQLLINEYTYWNY